MVVRLHLCRYVFRYLKLSFVCNLISLHRWKCSLTRIHCTLQHFLFPKKNRWNINEHNTSFLYLQVKCKLSNLQFNYIYINTQLIKTSRETIFAYTISHVLIQRRIWLRFLDLVQFQPIVRIALLSELLMHKSTFQLKSSYTRLFGCWACFVLYTKAAQVYSRLGIKWLYYLN